jgi:hypothetical protein
MQSFLNPMRKAASSSDIMTIDDDAMESFGICTYNDANTEIMIKEICSLAEQIFEPPSSDEQTHAKSVAGTVWATWQAMRQSTVYLKAELNQDHFSGKRFLAKFVKSMVPFPFTLLFWHRKRRKFALGKKVYVKGTNEGLSGDGPSAGAAAGSGAVAGPGSGPCAGSGSSAGAAAAAKSCASAIVLSQSKLS